MTPVKFSVLLPTRNRLDLLNYAVQTVLRQDYADWEIIISDNYSYQDISSYVASLADSRIHLYRTDESIPVTDNWNNALRYATGDYLIMLGDDDGLMRDFFSTIDDLIARFDQPDLVYTDAYTYAYPGVLPGFPDGFLRPAYNEDYFGKRDPFLLDRADALRIVRESFSFRMPVQYNMQLSVVRRAFAESLVPPFFQSPYPDYYATVAAFLKAQRILIYQQPVVTIGIAARSYGFFHFNDQKKEGAAFLNNTVDAQEQHSGRMLPGARDLNSWFLAMDTIAVNYPTDDLKVDYAAYRARQIDYVYRGHYIDGVYSADELRELEMCLTDTERRQYGTAKRLYYRLLGLIKKRLPPAAMRFVRRLRGKRSLFDDQRARTEGFQTILDVFDRMPPHL